jgi:hypothetical protein
MSLIRITAKKYSILVMGILMLSPIFFSQNAAGSNKSNNYFESLQKRLIEDGFDKDRITELYNRSEVYFERKGISRYLVHSEASLNYRKLLKGLKRLTVSIKRLLRPSSWWKPAWERCSEGRLY